MHSAYVDECPSDWLPVRIGEVCEIVGGGTPDRSVEAYWGGSIAWATPTDITSLDDIEIAFTKDTITEEGLSNSSARIIPPGSVLMTSRATIGYCAINRTPMATNQGFASIICGSKVHNLFLLYWLTLMKPKLERLASGSTFKEIGRSSLRSLTIHLPPILEQERIAEILHASESAIQRAKQSLSATMRLKHGLVRRLLTRGIGHTSFKQTDIGEIPESWNVVELRDVADRFIGGGTPATENQKYWGGKIPWMRGAWISSRYVARGEKMITRRGLEESSSNLVPAGSVLVATRVCIGNIAVNKIDVAISQDLTGIVVNSKMANPEYVFWALKSRESQLKRLNQGTAIKGVLRSDLEKLSVPLPPLDEQNRIVDVLSTADDSIQLESSEVSALGDLKKGLMQVLLTGKVRVKV